VIMGAKMSWAGSGSAAVLLVVMAGCADKSPGTYCHQGLGGGARTCHRECWW
jgi:hypothetical protein